MSFFKVTFAAFPKVNGAAIIQRQIRSQSYTAVISRCRRRNNNMPNVQIFPHRLNATRRWKSDSGGGKDSGQRVSNAAAAEEMEGELVMTTREKIKTGFNLTFWGGLFVFGGVCFMYTVRELWPSQLSTNSVFDEALNQIRKDHRVVDMIGDPIVGYGMDHGGKREGRRNFIMNRESTDADGVKRNTIKFNIEGPYCKGTVFAEVAENLDMKNGEWVYLIAQSKKTGQVVTLCDNRGALNATAGKTAEERSALARLLKGSGSY